jgi:hypothetical protein
LPTLVPLRKVRTPGRLSRHPPPEPSDGAVPSMVALVGATVVTAQSLMPAGCVRYSGMAHFDTLIWPTPDML